MNNLRIVADNAADRATLSASSTSGALAVTNLQSDKKSNVWRATATTATLTATWTAGETLACVALPFSNLSPTATIRVQCYDAATAGNLLLDTNTLQPNALACPAPAVALRGWTAAQAASAYAYGGGAHGRIWFAPTAGIKRLVVTLTDTGNAQGYIEAARLVCGPYWSPTYNTSSLSTTDVDQAAHTRTDAGDLWTDASTIHKRVPIELEYMPDADRTALAAILRASRAYPIFLSVFPENANLDLERAFTVYGKRMSDSEIASQAAICYGTKIEVESV